MGEWRPLGLPPALQTKVVSYLSPFDLEGLGSTSKQGLDLASQESIWRSIALRMWHVATHRLAISRGEGCYWGASHEHEEAGVEMCKEQTALAWRSVCAGMPITWPRELNHGVMEETGVYGVEPVIENGECLRVKCEAVWGDRAVVADQPFPSNWQGRGPFSLKLAANADEGLPARFMATCIAYYEVTFVAAPAPPAREDQEELMKKLGLPEGSQPDASPCVAVGLCGKSFLLKTRQPGWDRSSVGLHSDDGALFSGSSTLPRLRLGATFGPGDTVGCGITNMGVFFTLNSSVVVEYNRAPRDWPLYPVIGLAGYVEIKVNFGGTPFVYDLQGHQQRLWRDVAVLLARSEYPSPIRLEGLLSDILSRDWAGARAPDADDVISEVMGFLFIHLCY
ncbi:unnamed protein product [Chrysoparadoxa australica]